MYSKKLTITTGNKESIVDLTDRCSQFVSNQDSGLLNVFVQHSTCGLAIIENNNDVINDMLDWLHDHFPVSKQYNHVHGYKGHGRDHIIPSIFNPFCNIPVSSGVLQLGIWQSILLIDTNKDNNIRNVLLNFVNG